jgi:hypothetical protein
MMSVLGFWWEGRGRERTAKKANLYLLGKLCRYLYVEMFNAVIISVSVLLVGLAPSWLGAGPYLKSLMRAYMTWYAQRLRSINVRLESPNNKKSA